MKKWGITIIITAIFFGLSFGVITLCCQSAEIKIQNEIRAMDGQIQQLSENQKVLDVEIDRIAKAMDLERVAKKIAMDYPNSQQEIVLALNDGISAYDGVVLASRR
jgi:cell division protein FtsL